MQSKKSPLVLHSYAKINLYLRVLGKRSDGYHSLETIFERISLFDRITIRSIPVQEIRIKCNHPDVPIDTANLAYRSAAILREKFKVNSGVEVTIDKRIPVAAGLGGGSSNAAATLLGLNKFWGLGLSLQDLLVYARKLGSDVPFFIHDTPFARAWGRGEKVLPLKELKGVVLWHIIVVPAIKVSTPLIYEKWDEFNRRLGAKNTRRPGLFRLTQSPQHVKILYSSLARKDAKLIAGGLLNSLEPVSCSKFREIQRVKQRLTDLGVEAVMMSGSGPSVFGIVPSRKDAVSLCKQIAGENTRWRVFAVKTI